MSNGYYPCTYRIIYNTDVVGLSEINYKTHSRDWYYNIHYIIIYTNRTVYVRLQGFDFIPETSFSYIIQREIFLRIILSFTHGNRLYNII